MRHAYIGIDPGKRGGIAWCLDASEIHTIDMPTTSYQAPHKKKKGKTVTKESISFPGILEAIERIVDQYSDQTTTLHVAIERQAPMPDDGKPAIFTAGGNYRELFSAFMAIHRYHPGKCVIKMTEVQPTAWKAWLGVLQTGKNKDVAIKKITYNALVRRLGQDWCSANLLGPRGGLSDGKSDSVGILLHLMHLVDEWNK